MIKKMESGHIYRLQNRLIAPEPIDSSDLASFGDLENLEKYNSGKTQFRYKTGKGSRGRAICGIRV